MKIQDIAFVTVFVFLLYLRSKPLMLFAGLLCFFCAIPLFSQWIFFTAERLTWYGALLILCLTVTGLVERRKA
jgi:hypothetical protein